MGQHLAQAVKAKRLPREAIDPRLDHQKFGLGDPQGERARAELAAQRGHGVLVYPLAPVDPFWTEPGTHGVKPDQAGLALAEHRRRLDPSQRLARVGAGDARDAGIAVRGRMDYVVHRPPSLRGPAPPCGGHHWPESLKKCWLGLRQIAAPLSAFSVLM